MASSVASSRTAFAPKIAVQLFGRARPDDRRRERRVRSRLAVQQAARVPPLKDVTFEIDNLPARFDGYTHVPEPADVVAAAHRSAFSDEADVWTGMLEGLQGVSCYCSSQRKGRRKGRGSPRTALA